MTFLAPVGPYHAVLREPPERPYAFERAALPRLSYGRHDNDVAEAGLGEHVSPVAPCTIASGRPVEEVAAVHVVRHESRRLGRDPRRFSDLRELGHDLRPRVPASDDEHPLAANALRGTVPASAFFEAIQSWFGAQAEDRDFADPATLDAINCWADEHTNGRITEVLDEIDPDHSLSALRVVSWPLLVDVWIARQRRRGALMARPADRSSE